MRNIVPITYLVLQSSAVTQKFKPPLICPALYGVPINQAHVKKLKNEISNNFVSIISFRKTAGFSSTLIPALNDFLIWYAKDKSKVKFHQLFLSKIEGIDKGKQYKFVELPNGERRKLTPEEIMLEIKDHLQFILDYLASVSNMMI